MSRKPFGPLTRAGFPGWRWSPRTRRRSPLTTQIQSLPTMKGHAARRSPRSWLGTTGDRNITAQGLFTARSARNERSTSIFPAPAYTIACRVLSAVHEARDDQWLLATASSANTLAVGNNAVLMIEISGANVNAGLDIFRWRRAAWYGYPRTGDHASWRQGGSHPGRLGQRRDCGQLHRHRRQRRDILLFSTANDPDRGMGTTIGVMRRPIAM